MNSATSFVANGMITLTTDFGEREPFVGLMKAMILRRFAQAEIIDLCHGLPKFQPEVASFWLERCWPYFTDGTVHLAVVDPGVGGQRLMKWVCVASQLFVAPDNGLLDALENHPAWRESRTFDVSDVGHLNLGPVSHTFHGRDVFAPLVAELAAGRQSLAKLGKSIPLATREAVKVVVGPNDRLGRVRVIDDFGNLLTDIPERLVLEFGAKYVRYGFQLIEIKRTYSLVPPGKLVALINSFGVLEIAVSNGSAAECLNAKIGDRVELVSGS